MLIAVASAAGRPARKRDVNEILDSGAGWTKGADGYKYDIPEVKLDEVVVPEVVQEVEVIPEIVQEPVYEGKASPLKVASLK